MGEWRETAEWDWVHLGDGRTLHAIKTLDDEAATEEEWGGDGETECGRHGHLRIPGLFSRMSRPRCSRCCTATGMPQGKQSPKNVDECRPLVEARLAALKQPV